MTNTQPGFGAPGPGAGFDIALNPTNSFIYVSSIATCKPPPGAITNGQNEIWVFDGSTNTDNSATSETGPWVWASGGLNPGDGGFVVTNYAQDYFQYNLIQPYGIAISPDGQYMGLGDEVYAQFTIVKLTNGIPDISTTKKSSLPPYTGTRSVAFDAADNFYTVDGNSDSLRCYSLGFSTTCITSNDVTAANGSFQLILPSASVSVTATTPMRPPPVPRRPVHDHADRAAPHCAPDGLFHATAARRPTAPIRPRQHGCDFSPSAKLPPISHHPRYRPGSPNHDGGSVACQWLGLLGRLPD